MDKVTEWVYRRDLKEDRIVILQTMGEIFVIALALHTMGKRTGVVKRRLKSPNCSLGRILPSTGTVEDSSRIAFQVPHHKPKWRGLDWGKEWHVKDRDAGCSIVAYRTAML